MKAIVHVMLKPGVLDPQGKAICHALDHMGFDGVEEVRQGKVFEIELKGRDAATAKRDLDAMCRRLLANTVIESYTIDVES